MSGWFDTYAKKSAPPMSSAAAGSRGPSRRRVLLGGSAAVATTAAAWTAPALMASAAATVGLSACLPGEIETCPNGTTICCPDPNGLGFSCQLDPVTGMGQCVQDGTEGGFCGACGNSNCPEEFKCNGNPNQNNNAEAPNICGGEGAQCCAANEDLGGCAGTTLVCTPSESTPGADFCRKQCEGDLDCRTPGVTPGSECPQAPGDQVCSGTGFCGTFCDDDGDCGGNNVCESGTCSYDKDANLTDICAAA